MRDFKISNRITDTSDNLSRYFKEVSKYELLTPERELELAIKYKKGDDKAKEKIIESNLRFVISVAKSYRSSNNSLEDLISEGNKGLVEAIETYDASSGFKFISYAVWHIRKHIFYYLSNYSKSIRIPSNISHEIRRYQKLENDFISYNGREPSVDEIISIMDDSGKDLELSNAAVEVLKNPIVSFPLENDPNSKEDESFSPINWIESQEKTDKSVMDGDSKMLLDSVLSELSPKERKVIMMKYGIGENVYPMTYSNIAENFGKTPEWARGIAKKAEKRIRFIIMRRKLLSVLL